MDAIKQRRTKDDTSQQTYVLMLGLFLILLAFFILLNAISTLKEERVSQVSSGLWAGFGVRQGNMILPASEARSLLEGHDAVLQKIVSLFEDTLPGGAEVKGTHQLATTLLVRVEDFFEPGTATLKPIRAGFFTQVAGLVQTKEGAPIIRLRLQVPAEQGIENGLDLGGLRAMRLARSLVEAGVNSQNLNARVIEEEAEFINVQIQTYLPQLQPGRNL